MQRNNPFFHRGPIRSPRYFWGRNSETERTSFLVSRAQCVSIVGARRIGKTSLLYQFERILSMVQQNSDVDPRVCIVFFGCEGWSGQNREALYALFWNTIRAAMKNNGLDPSDYLKAHQDASPLTYRAFNNEIRRIAEKGVRLVLVFDEFEALSFNPHLDAGFFSGLRALSTNYQVTFVTSSQRSLGLLTFAEPSALSSPFFNIFSQVNLRPFTSAEAAEMLLHFVSMGEIAFDDALLSFVLSLAGPHPFFLQVAGFYAYERSVENGGSWTGADYAWLRREFIAQSNPHWRYCWHHLSSAQRQALAFHNDAEPPSDSNLRTLIDLGLLIEQDGQYSVLSSALAEFISRRPVNGLLQAPPVVIDLAQRRVLIDGRSLTLNRLEFELITLLVEEAGRFQPFRTIEAQLWPEDVGQINDPERLKAVIKNLRGKLNNYAHLIENERGIGYRFAGRRVQPFS